MFQKMSHDMCVGCTVALLAVFTITVIIPLGVTDPGTVELTELAPAFWPQIIMTLLVFIGVTIVGAEFATMKRRKTEENTKARSKESFSLSVKAFRFLIAFGLLLLTYFSIDYLGMLLSTAINLVCFLLLGNVRSTKMLIGLSVLLPCFLYVFFVYVANVPLPVGNLFYSLM